VPTLDVDQSLRFLDLLDPRGRHTLASEAPFGAANGDPKWEGGATYEVLQLSWLIADLRKRQARGSNVYYGVNRPCPVTEQRGSNGKCTVDDIIAVRALAFDIDITKRPFDNQLLLDFINERLTGVLRPSLVINTGGGFHLIYLLEQFVNVELSTDNNDRIIANRRNVTKLAGDFETLLRKMIPVEISEYVKIDSMSNVDRVMRLPGTINYPKAEKIAKGQVESLAHIAIDYQCKCDIVELRNQVPKFSAAPIAKRTKFARPPNSKWSEYEKAVNACEFVRDNGLADANEIYSHEVMLPLIGAWLDGDITVEEAEECFLEAVSGGARYGFMGRSLGYFKRAFRSHLGVRREGHAHLGTLIGFCKENGYVPPWTNEVNWEDNFIKQQKELSEARQHVDEELVQWLKSSK
jgi:hypothetical protein